MQNEAPPTVFAQTQRLNLRALAQKDLAAYVLYLNDWEVTRWLSRVPYPYTIDHARQWLDMMEASYRKNAPEVFVLADRQSDATLGAVGFHAPSTPQPQEGEAVLGYWLGRPLWGKGLMTEAVAALWSLIFARPELRLVTTFTDIDNVASQNVLRKTGMRYLGVGPRTEQNALRGNEQVTRWEITRQDLDAQRIKCSTTEAV